jgi:nicotinamidase-related amidase
MTRISEVKPLGCDAVLLVIDVQAGFDDPAWGERNNPQAESNIAMLLAAWREAGAPVVHVLHDSVAATGRLRPGTPGNLPKPEGRPLPGEAVYRKRVNGAFIGTGLEADLRRRGVTTLVLVGLTTNHCVSTTARMAANLAFEVVVVADATAAFARAQVDGRMRDAQSVHDAALSDLQDEFARVVETSAVLAALTTTEAAYA